jgi:transposase
MKVDEGLHIDEGSEIHQHSYLPAIAAYCRKLGVIELVNDMVPNQMNVSPGHIVQAMVLDTLSGRSPLYRLQEFMDGKDVNLLLGKDIDPKKFNDTNVGRALDSIFEAGSSKILTRLGDRAATVFDLDMSIASYDTTSVNVWGDYEGCESENPPDGPKVTHGFSKDHRPDLKQFMTELLCVERGVPIFGKTLDGNASDKTNNNEMLTNITSILADKGIGPGDFVYVADSAMVTENNLKQVGANNFITRLPATYSECSRVIEEAVKSDEWISHGVLAETKETANRPAARYKSQECELELYGEKYRAVVVHSSAHDSRRQKKLQRELEKSEKAIQKNLRTLNMDFACEEDAKRGLVAIENESTKLHTVKAIIKVVEVRKRGRPPKNSPAAVREVYRIEWSLSENNYEVERLKKISGCFVLLTNVPLNGKLSMSSLDILKTYKGQHGVESAFAFLKDPLVVNDTFLKKPSRIDALGMVLIISLMVWRLMERSMRAYVAKSRQPMPGLNNRKTNKPTTFMVTVFMTGIMVLLTHIRQVNVPFRKHFSGGVTRMSGGRPRASRYCSWSSVKG